MSDRIAITNRASLPDAQFEPLREILSRQTSMERALVWFFSSRPPLAPVDMVAQDEFSYDLLVPFTDGLTLSYDTN